MNPKTLAEARKSPDNSHRICGIHILPDGQLSAVWLTHDKDSGGVVVYDTFRPQGREVIAVVAEAIKSRGKKIPVSWNENGKEIAELLMEHGVNTITEPVKDSNRVIEATANEVWERMRTGRFRVKEHLHDWFDEMKTYQRQDGGVPLDSHPLMNATLHAVARLEWAKSTAPQPLNYQQVAIV